MTALAPSLRGNRWQRFVALTAASIAVLGMSPSAPAFASSDGYAATYFSSSVEKPTVSDLTAVQRIRHDDPLSFSAQWVSNGASQFEVALLRVDSAGRRLVSVGTTTQPNAIFYVGAGTYRLTVTPVASEDGSRGETESVDVVVARPDAPQLLDYGTTTKWLVGDGFTAFTVAWKASNTNPARHIKGYYVRVDGELVAGTSGKDASGRGTFQVAFPVLAGRHTVAVVAQDNYDNRSVPAEVTVTVPATPTSAPPVVTTPLPHGRVTATPRITTKSGQKVGSRMTVRWTPPMQVTAAPAKVVGYEVRVSRVRWISVPASKTSLSLAVQKGHHTLCVRAVYARGVSGADCITMRR